jgi:HPt (histidine-containing phosphotransfer) domain-containing protein
MSGLNTELEKKIQSIFVNSYQRLFEDITKSLEEQDIALAHRHVHSLKSNAAQLGKTTLHHIAAEIEAILKDGKNTVTEEQLKSLEKELTAVLNEYAPLLEDHHLKAAKTRHLDIEAAKKLIDKLEPLVQMGSPESVNFLDSLCQIPNTEKLIEQIDNFDFESAVVTLSELKGKLGIT